MTPGASGPPPAAIPDPGCLVNPVCMAEKAANSAIESAFTWLSQQIGEAIMSALKFLTSSWITVPTPGVDSGPLESLTGNLAWIAGVLGALALMVSVAKMAVSSEVRHGAGGVKMLLSYSVTSAGAITITATAIAASDQLAVWILGLSPQGISPEKMSTVFNVTKFAGTNPTGGASMFLVIVMGFLMVCALLAQILLMVLRNAALPLLLMGLQFTAATSASPEGDARFKKNIGWLISFIAYKPVAAAIYALGLSFIGTPAKPGGDSAFELFNGFAVILLATIALPALLKLVTPAPGTGTSAAFSGGAVAAGVVATGATVVGLGAAVASGGGAASAGAPTAASGAGGASLAPALHGASVGTSVAPPPDGDDLIPQGADAA